MFIKKDGFLFRQYGEADVLVVEENRIAETIEYINRANISKLSIIGIHYKRTDIDFLKKCPSVSKIMIQTKTITDCSGLYEMKNLNVLSLPDGFAKIDISGLCNIHEFYGSIETIQNLNKCTGIKKLWTYGQFPDRNLHILQTLTKLEELRITQANIVSLKGIASLKNLHKSEFYYLRNLSDISEINRIATTLTDLSFDNCPHLCGYESLGALNKLETLVITKCSPIPNLSFLEKITNLKNFDFTGTVIEDGNLTFCKGIAHTWFNNKKHYSHTFQQLNLKDWKTQKENEKRASTQICFMNDVELEPQYFVSLFFDRKSKTIQCQTKDNTKDNTEFRCYIFDKITNSFLDDEKGDKLPDIILKNKIFAETVQKIKLQLTETI